MTPEIILCSAIWYDDGESYLYQPENVLTGFVVCGYRHSGCLEIKSKIPSPSIGVKNKPVQGFLTSKNRFLDRKAAVAVAVASGQVHPDRIHNGELYSEDLYTNHVEKEDAAVFMGAVVGARWDESCKDSVVGTEVKEELDKLEPDKPKRETSSEFTIRILKECIAEAESMTVEDYNKFLETCKSRGLLDAPNPVIIDPDFVEKYKEPVSFLSGRMVKELRNIQETLKKGFDSINKNLKR